MVAIPLWILAECDGCRIIVDSRRVSLQGLPYTTYCIQNAMYSIYMQFGLVARGGYILYIIHSITEYYILFDLCYILYAI